MTRSPIEPPRLAIEVADRAPVPAPRLAIEVADSAPVPAPRLAVADSAPVPAPRLAVADSAPVQAGRLAVDVEAEVAQVIARARLAARQAWLAARRSRAAVRRARQALRPRALPPARTIPPRAARGTGSRLMRALRYFFPFAILLTASLARAAPVTIGVFAPSAPFPSTAARVELANQLGGELGKALDQPASGRVYARAADFAAAVKRGEVVIALVDPAYLATAPAGGTVVATALHGGEAERGWQLVARAGIRLADLRGKRVLVPSLGGREADFVANVLFAGDLPRGTLQLDAAPDTAAALATLALGKADAAIVPITELPAGIAAVLALPAVPDPVLVVYGAAPANAVLAAALGFTGDATVSGFRAADGELVRAVARRFVVAVKRAPFVLPGLRGVDLDALLAGRRFAIERTPAAGFAALPAAH